MKYYLLRLCCVASASLAVLVSFSPDLHAGVAENTECKIWCNDEFSRCAAFNPTRIPNCVLQSEACVRDCNRKYPTGSLFQRFLFWVGPSLKAAPPFDHQEKKSIFNNKVAS